MTGLTDQHLLAAYLRSAGLESRREGEGLWKVQSSRFPDLFYDVSVTETMGSCNCPAGFQGKACRHLALVVAREFPHLLTRWHIEARHKRECDEWRKSVAASVSAEWAQTEGMRERFKRRQQEWLEFKAMKAAELEAIAA